MIDIRRRTVTFGLAAALAMPQRPAWADSTKITLILTTRPRRKGLDYDKIWNRERNESPLKTITRSQAAKLRATTDAIDPTIVVDWGMRYGNPSMDSRIEAMAKAGCERILVVPLYPQYAAATSATVCDAAFATLQ